MSRLGLLGLLLLVAACGKDRNEPGRFVVRWTGADTGKLNLPATARWCQADTALEVTGIEGDSGVAVAIFPPDTVMPGVYPVGAPGQGMARPRAGVALRRFGENLIIGSYSLSGTVTVDSGSPFHGTLQATLKGVSTGDQVNVTGRFRVPTIERGEAVCREAAIGNAADTMVR